jgi:N-acyl-phosphatidylethanolamine-hydrolysing phospholipase D
MSDLKIIAYITMALIGPFACASIPSQSNGDISLEKSPKREHHTENGFQNYPFVETAAPKGFLFYMRRFWGSVFTPDIPDGHALSEEDSLQLLNSIDGDRLSWLGHASFLIHTSGVTILTDPLLTEFASPISWAGPRRYTGSGISLENLPKIDIVLISHNHYDHLDKETVNALHNKEGIHAVVPLGLKSFFTESGYENVTELDWNDSLIIKNIEITSLPAVHDSARSVSDRNKTLWSSWAIKGPERNVLFVGDTGYSEVIFRDIGKMHGPFDYAILPIGGYEPRELMWMSHVTPEEAVSIGTDVHAKTLIASHWGTVSSLSDEPLFEPPGRFKREGAGKGYSEQDLWVMKIGETRPLQNRVLLKIH